jgi:putative two-component system response regulator
MSTIQPEVLIVDPQPMRIGPLQRILADVCITRHVTSIEAAVADIHRSLPALVIADCTPPLPIGMDLCKRLHAEHAVTEIPVILVSATHDIEMEELGFALGAVDFIHRPLSPPLVRARVRTHLRLHDHARLLVDMVSRRTRQLETTRLEIIRRLGRASEFKDDDTGMHVIRMSHFCRLIALEAGLSEAAADLLLQAAPMHDIGKIGIPDHILQKPGKLTDEEWVIMRKHPAIGAGIIGRHEDVLLDTARVVALTHHEKWDGSGYPRKIGGEQIPLTGRIVAIADVFDALTSVRPYKKAWDFDVAVQYVRDGAGSQFDPDLVDCFVKALPQINEIRERYGNDKELKEEEAAAEASAAASA